VLAHLTLAYARGEVRAKACPAGYLRSVASACHDPFVVRTLSWTASVALTAIFAALGSACSKGAAPSPAKVPETELASAPLVERIQGADRAEPPPALPATPLPVLPASSRLPAQIGALQGIDRLSHLFEALAALEAGRPQEDVHVVQYGDSHTASDSGTSVVRRLLQARFGSGGRGFVAIGKPWKTYTQDGIRGGMTALFSPARSHVEQGRTMGDGCYGPLGVAIGADESGARAWTSVTVPASRVEVDYWQQPYGGSFDVFIDGAHTGRVATRAAEPAPGFLAFDLPDTPHEVELRTVGEGSVRVFGMALDRTQAGVVVDALGINGAQIFTALRWNEEHFAAELRHRAPDVVVLAYGTNEALDPKLDLGLYERSLVELLGRVARATPSASCLLLGPPDLGRWVDHQGWIPWPPVLDVAAVQKRVAQAAGCAYYSQIDAMGGPGSMLAWATESEPRAQTDRTHLTRAGYAQVATSFTTDLLRAYDAWRDAGDLPPTSAAKTWVSSR
jgi:lysophospholipase L1-like esterase